MPAYMVVLRMEIEADTPQEAAAEALKIHRDPESLATLFSVFSEGRETVVDLEDEQWWTNHYTCARCGYSWIDEWTATCDDRCPKCHQSTSPHTSEEI